MMILISLLWATAGLAFGIQDSAIGYELRNESVFGVALTVRGAQIAVSFPDGSIEGLGQIDGNQSYQDLMNEWFALCTGQGTRIAEAYPPLSREQIHSVQQQWLELADESRLPWFERVQYKLGWKHRDMEALFAIDFFREDRATQLLSDLFCGIRDAANQRLKGLGRSTITGRPFVEVALPGCFFETRRPLVEHPDIETTSMAEVSADAFLTLTQRISTALHRSGFRRSISADPNEIMVKHHRGESPASPVPAPEAIIEQILGGSCAGDLSYLESCRARRPGASKCLAFLLVIEDLGSSSWLSAWSTNLQIFPKYRIRTQHWPITHTPDDALRIKRVLNEVVHFTEEAALEMDPARSFSDCEVELLLSGHQWEEGLMDVLQQFASDSGIRTRILSPQDLRYLAAMGAAEAARAEHNMLWLGHPNEVQEGDVADREL